MLIVSDIIKRCIIVVTAVAVLVVPLLIVPTGLDPFRFPKTLLIRGCGISLIALFLLRGLWSSNENRRIFEKRQDQIALGVVCWIGVLALTSREPAVSARAVLDVLCAFGVFYGARFIAVQTGARLLRWLALAPAAVNIFILSLQLLNLWHPLVSSNEFETLPEDDRLLLSRAALLGNRDDVGVYLALVYAVAIGSVCDRNPRYVRVWLAASVILAAGVVMTGTVTAVGAVCVVSGVVLALTFRNRQNHPVWRSWVAVGVVLVCSIAGASQFDRVTTYQRQLREGDWEGATGKRFRAWSVAMRMISDDPLRGVGPGLFPYRSTEVAIALRDERRDLYGQSTGVYFDMVHNDYLEIASEVGILGLVGALALVAAFVLGSERKGRWSSEQSITRIAIASVLLVTAISQFPLQIAVFYGTMAALAGEVAD